NEGIARAGSELIALVDDDVYAPPGWLRALVDGARRHPDAAVIGGPIRARLEGPAPRACGREQPPITTLDLGPHDVETKLGWSAPGLPRELRVLAGCGWHTVRRGCPQGLVMGAHSAGRLVEAVRRR